MTLHEVVELVRKATSEDDIERVVWGREYRDGPARGLTMLDRRHLAVHPSGCVDVIDEHGIVLETITGSVPERIAEWLVAR